MPGDDLTTLFTSTDESTPLRYRQGRVLWFDKLTLENRILVGATELVNLPILGVGETTMLAPGDVVGILVMGPMMAILGQLVIPATAAAGDATSLGSANTYSVSVDAFENRSSAIWGDLDTVGPVVPDVRIGPSGRCLVWISSSITLLTTAGGGEMTYEISGATTVLTGDSPPSLANYNAAGSVLIASRLVLQEGLNPGLHTITAKYSATDFGPEGSAQFGGRNLTVMAL